jgi:hypothetical protein
LIIKFGKLFLDKSNTTINEIITDDLNILENLFYIQLAFVPFSFNHCISIIILLIEIHFLCKDSVIYSDIQFSFSSDYGYTWQSIDRDDILIFDENYFRRTKIFTWKFTSMMIG